MTRTESPPPAAASRSSTAAEATGSRRLWDREVEAEVDKDREEDGDEELDQEAARGVEKWLRPGWMEAVETTAAVASSMAAARSGAARLFLRGRRRGEGIRI